MEWFFASGHAVDLVLLVLGSEFLLLWRMGRDPKQTFLMLLPAVLILLALRAALVGADWIWVAGFLALSFPTHLADLGQRKKNAGP